MEVVWITRWDELAGLAPYWTALARGVPFRSWCWLAGWWRHYSDADDESRSLFALAVYDRHNNLIGLAPWFIDSRSKQGDVVRFLGSGDVCSDYLSILTLPGREEEVAEALAEWLCRDSRTDGWNSWNVLSLGGVDAADGVMRRFIDEMQSRGSLVYRKASPNCWRINLPPTWEDYLATVSKSHRKQLRRLQRRLFDTGRAVSRVVKEPAGLERGLAVLSDLHQRRRRALGEAGRFADDSFASFHREVAGQLLDQSALRLSWIELDGRSVAAEYQVLGSDVVYAYQSGIDPAALDCEPGRLAMMATLRRSIEEGCRAFDLLRGDEPYKAHWRARPRASMEVSILPGRGADWLKHGAWLAGRQVRQWLGSWKVAAPLPQEA